MIILVQNLGHPIFCVEGGFYFRVVDMPPDEIIYAGWPITDELLMSHRAVYCAVQDDDSRGCSETFH